MKDIKKEIDLLIQLQNDVKMIHQGCYFTYQQDTTYYLYINEVGIGSSYFYKDEPLYGNTGIMGEIGLISFKEKRLINAFVNVKVKMNLMNFWGYW